MKYKITFLGSKGMIEESSPHHKLRTGIVVETRRARFQVDCGEEEFFDNLRDVDFLYVSHCYDEKTEVFTNHGWKRFAELSSSDCVATLDENDQLVFEKPVDYIEQDYTGLMYYLSTDFLNMMVTPNHNLYISENFDDPSFSLVPAAECFGRPKMFTCSFKCEQHDASLIQAVFSNNYSSTTELVASCDQESWVPYDGKVYCVTLPEHTRHVLLTRREGKVCFSGNSHPDHVSGLKHKEIPTTLVSTSLVRRQLVRNWKVTPTLFSSLPFEYEDVSLKAVPCFHSIRCPMWGVVINNELGIFTDVIRPRAGWKVLKGLRVYVGDGSAINHPIIRVKEKGGEPFGHTCMKSQLRYASQLNWQTVVFTHLGRQPVLKGDEKVKEILGVEDLIIAKDGLTIEV